MQVRCPGPHRAPQELIDQLDHRRLFAIFKQVARSVALADAILEVKGDILASRICAAAVLIEGRQLRLERLRSKPFELERLTSPAARLT